MDLYIELIMDYIIFKKNKFFEINKIVLFNVLYIRLYVCR